MELFEKLTSLLEKDKDRMFWLYQGIRSDSFAFGPIDFRNYVSGYNLFSSSYLYIWTADNSESKVYEEVLDGFESTFPDDTDMIIICKPELRLFFEENIKNYKIRQRYKGSLTVHTCHALKAFPEHTPGGKLRLCTAQDIDTVTEILNELEQGALLSNEKNHWTNESILAAIELKLAYFYINSQGNIVSFCLISPQFNNVVLIGCLYTYPEYRRKGYATDLVHELTREMICKGITPHILSDTASPIHINCDKIGYVPSEPLDVLKA